MDDEHLEGLCAVPACSGMGLHQITIGTSKVIVCERHHDKAYALNVDYRHAFIDLQTKFHRLFRELKGGTNEGI